MAFIAIGAALVSVAATAYGTIQQKKAADKAAAIDKSTADYNARLDESMAAQLDLDTVQNIRLERQDAQVYLSREAASYAAAGVLADTGSPLHAQITNAGRFEQKLQQDYTNSVQKQQQLYSSASVGRLEGAAKAEADNARGTLALVDGGAKIAGQAFKAYDSGVFNFSAAGG